MQPNADRPSTFQRILFCTDFSENSDLAFRFALDSATRRPGSTLYILHVIPEPDAQFWKTYIYEVNGVDEKAHHDIDAKIEEAYLRQVPPGQKTEVAVRIGRDSAVILDFAREKDIELIIIGRQGRSALGKMLFGNVTEKVARKSRCPVLIIPLSYAASPAPEKGSD